MGRDLSELETRHLQLLVELRQRAARYATDYSDRLEDFVLECREDGASVRKIAQALDVGASTVQTWTNNARRRRED